MENNPKSLLELKCNITSYVDQQPQHPMKLRRTRRRTTTTNTIRFISSTTSSPVAVFAVLFLTVATSTSRVWNQLIIVDAFQGASTTSSTSHSTSSITSSSSCSTSTSSSIFASTLIPHPYPDSGDCFSFDQSNNIGPFELSRFTSSSSILGERRQIKNRKVGDGFYYYQDTWTGDIRQDYEQNTTPEWVQSLLDLKATPTRQQSKYQSTAPAFSPGRVQKKVRSSAGTSLRTVSSDELEYLQRKAIWASKYTSVQALRETFGTNRNKFWGDLDPKTTRRLYKTLLPRALMELHCNAIAGNRNSTSEVSPAHLSFTGRPEDLAPLAYQARVAAKLYARERCELPARVLANLYDGFRQWKRYGQFNVQGMSYQQLWEKYAAVILHDVHKNDVDLTVEDLTAKICLKILEKSCQTNAKVDRLVRYQEPSSSSTSDRTKEDEWNDLKVITAQLEEDARNLLRPQPSLQDNMSNIFTTIGYVATDHNEKDDSQEKMKVIAKVNSSLLQKEKEQRDFQQKKIRLIRSVLRLKRKLERYQKLHQLNLLQHHNHNK